MNRHAAARLLADLLVPVIEERRDLEALHAKPRIVREGETQIARAHDRHAELLIQPENLPEMPFQIAHVVTDAADAELAEVREVLADLRGVQVKLLGQRLRRNCPHAGAVERIQAAEIDREAVCGEFGDLLGALADFRRLVRGFHKRPRL